MEFIILKNSAFNFRGFFKIVVKSLFCLFIFIIPHRLIGQEDCCNDIICKNEAKGFANRFISITSSPLFHDPPLKDDLKNQLKNIQKEDPGLYKKFTGEIQSFASWLEKGEGNAICFYRNMDEEHEINKDWVVYVTSLFGQTSSYSPEYCKGFRFLIDVSTGVKDIGISSESFIGSLTGLTSYTFAPKNKNIANDTMQCNGRFRIMLGLSESYVDQIGLTQGVLRGELKLFDLKTQFFSIGNVKSIAQVNLGINRNYHSVGIGIGAEFEIIGFNLMYGYGIKNMHSLLQTSLIYQFKMMK